MLIVSSFVWIGYQRVTDRRTDRQNCKQCGRAVKTHMKGAVQQVGGSPLRHVLTLVNENSHNTHYSSSKAFPPVAPTHRNSLHAASPLRLHTAGLTAKLDMLFCLPVRSSISTKRFTRYKIFPQARAVSEQLLNGTSALKTVMVRY